MKPDTTYNSSSYILKTSPNNYKEIPKSSYEQQKLHLHSLFQEVGSKLMRRHHLGIGMPRLYFSLSRWSKIGFSDQKILFLSISDD